MNKNKQIKENLDKLGKSFYLYDKDNFKPLYNTPPTKSEIIESKTWRVWYHAFRGISMNFL